MATILRVSGLALSVLATPASAGVITYTFTGTVAHGFDRTGLFGTKGRLDGESFKVIETFDPSQAASVVTDGSTFSQQIGGASYGFPQSATAQIKIGDSQFHTIFDDLDIVTSGFGSTSTSVSRGVGADLQGSETLLFEIFAPTLSYDYGAAFSAKSQDPDVSFTGIYSLFDPSSVFGEKFKDDVRAEFNVDEVEITPVPLPSTIPMFATALFALGAAQVWRKRNTRMAA